MSETGSPADSRAESPAPGAVGTRDWITAILLSTIVSGIAVAIGEHSFQAGPAAIVLFPVVWVVLLGAIVGLQTWKPLSGATRSAGEALVPVGMVLFLALLGTGIGPSLGMVEEVGPALLMQELGQLFGTIILALPIAVLMGMGRAAIGATWAIDRESYLAYAIDRFGTSAPEYRGVFGVWLIGSMFGAVFMSLITGLLGGLDWYHPLSLALALGVGSTSMMLGGVGALSLLYPDMAGEIMALAALSNLVTNIVGFYSGVFIGLPVARKLYLFWCRLFRRPQVEIEEARLVAKGLVPAGDASVRVKHGQEKTAAEAAPGAKEERGPEAEGEPADTPQDPPVPTGWRPALTAYVFAGTTGLLLNWLGTGGIHLRDVGGIVVLLALTWVAILLSKKVRAIPATVWVLTLATLATAPISPVADGIAYLVQDLEVLLVGLPQLALIGMNMGRDRKAFTQLSWKVVVAAVLTFTCTIVAAASLAEIFIDV
ncbi:DUF3100 domain-containing protein [Brevibacterium sp.]|uniref:DUF3100 domain-containing protein n=1 Tax=Brevibacterium sp. TaxID=1701 RepID=UPI0025C38EB2|nr:DUF3100 domain-containing protein [Brevibacterium sp.]